MNKLWSFILGCITSASFIWLAGVSEQLTVPNISVFSFQGAEHIYSYIALFVMSLLFSAAVLLFKHYVLGMHHSEHTSWLILPILIFLVLTFVFAKAFLIIMLTAAIPSLMLILMLAIRKKPRRILFN